MAVVLISHLEPQNNGDFHLIEDIYLKGGFRAVSNIAARNAITLLRRKNGMRVGVMDNGSGAYKEYMLKLGTVDNNLSNNGNWVEYSSGGSGGTVTGKHFNLIEPNQQLQLDPNEEYFIKKKFYNKGLLTIDTNGMQNLGSGASINTDAIFICEGVMLNEGIIINNGQIYN